MSACFALVEAQVSVLRQCRMIAHIRPLAGVAEDEVVRIPIRSADNLPLEHSGAFRIHIRGPSAPGVPDGVSVADLNWYTADSTVSIAFHWPPI